MKNILLIVNEFKLRSQVKSSLSKKIFHVIYAQDSVEGIRLVEEQYPDLIITDLDCSRPENYSLLKELSELTYIKKTPILVFYDPSQSTDQDVCLKLIKLGINLYFPTSINFDYLINKIEQELNLII